MLNLFQHLFSYILKPILLKARSIFQYSDILLFEERETKNCGFTVVNWVSTTDYDIILQTAPEKIQGKDRIMFTSNRNCN
ncbi:hypothetical protein DU508_12960 [Pedobacter chinensis]|uniref:Uncharacterized protein n=1 Tax=Pedobacter chinensis TaxID=2282421 RepID=A0A369PW53_9SPHI|nr:hypothetical protein DU508_12960 [Pedobacter chinensis]